MRVVPKKKRLQVYKKAFEVISNKINFSDLGDDRCLCMLLIMIHDPLEYPTYISTKCEWENTPKLFPEFGRYYTYGKGGYYTGECLKDESLYEKNKDKWRIKILNEIIESMEK